MKNNNQEPESPMFSAVALILIGLLSGFVGMVVFAILVPPTDLFGDMLNALLAGFFTMTATIILGAYLHNRKKRSKSKQNNL